MIRTQAWPELAKAVDGPLRDFIGRIAASPHAAALHGYATSRSIAIARTAEVKEGQERLIVCVDGGRLHLAYTDWGTWDVKGPTPTIRGKDSWVRDYAPEEAWPAFLKFLRRTGWVPDADKA